MRAISATPGAFIASWLSIRGTTGVWSPSDFKQALQCLQRPGPRGRSRRFSRPVVAVHQNNWRLLQAAADSFHRRRTVRFCRSGGSSSAAITAAGANTSARLEPDRVRALQLMQQALPLVDNEPEHEAVAEFYLDLANQFLTYRAWRRGVEAAEPHRSVEAPRLRVATSGFGARGRSVLRSMPTATRSFIRCRRATKRQNRTASAGGGRWPKRRILSQQPRIAPRWRLADFLHQQFGVQTLANVRTLLRTETTKQQSEANAPFAVDTLKDDETIARLATGIKRFKLPDEFNFLRIYRDVAASGKKPEAERALATLAGIYENRRQYPQAAELWRECIRRFGPGNQQERQQRLDQIVGNWGRFEPTTTLPATAGQNDRLPLPQRHAARTRSARHPRRKAPRGREDVPQIEPHVISIGTRSTSRTSAIGSWSRINRNISANASPSGA